MATEKTEVIAEDQIRKLIDDWTKALRAKDVEGIMSNYAAEIVSFDIAPPLRQRLRAAAYRKGLEEWFSTFEGSIGYEVSELEIAVSGDLGLAHSINHMSGQRKLGENTDIQVQSVEEMDVWVRSTIEFRKINGKWKITHEHVSVPFYMDGSYKAAIDLKP
jgi:ketosteroid isomerase-like protein